MADASDTTPGPTPETRQRIAAEVQHFLRITLTKMGLEVEVSERPDPEELVFEVHGEDAGLAIGKKGATLDALQLLCGRIASKFPGGGKVPVTLDAQGYRARRERTLTEMAERLGEQAVHRGQVITLDPLNARERRVVHMVYRIFRA